MNDVEIGFPRAAAKRVSSWLDQQLQQLRFSQWKVRASEPVCVRNCAPMLAMILGILAGCGGKNGAAPIDVEKQAFDDLRTEVKVAIDDPSREAEALTVVDELATELAQLRGSISERNAGIRRLNANYDTKRAEFEVFFKDIYTEIRSNQQRVTETHRALLAITTPPEWEQISAARTEAMLAAIDAINHE